MTDLFPELLDDKPASPCGDAGLGIGNPASPGNFASIPGAVGAKLALC